MLRRLLLVVLAIGSSCSSAAAEDVVLRSLAPGEHYLKIVVGADGSVSALPLRSVTVGTPTNPPPTDPPPGPNPTAFVAEVERITNAALSAGGTKTTGAALSSVYSLVSTEVAEGRIPPTNALLAVASATSAVLTIQADRAAWAPWRTSVSGALTTLAQQGQLSTKEQYAAVLKDVARGLDRATGNSLSPQQALARKPATGILDGIDLAKLIELIKIIMELLKIFGGFAK